MKIHDIAIFKVSGHWTGTSFPPGDRQVQSLDIYPEFNRPVDYQWKKNQPIHALYVEVQTDEGISGLFALLRTMKNFCPSGPYSLI